MVFDFLFKSSISVLPFLHFRSCFSLISVICPSARFTDQYNVHYSFQTNSLTIGFFVLFFIVLAFLSHCRLDFCIHDYHNCTPAICADRSRPRSALSTDPFEYYREGKPQQCASYAPTIYTRTSFERQARSNTLINCACNPHYYATG